MQYLGTGPIVVQSEVVRAGKPPEWVTIHTFLFPNTLTTSTVGNPSLPFSIIARSTGSTTALTVSSASYAGFIEGAVASHGLRGCYVVTDTGVGDTNYQNLVTVRNSRFFKSRVNQAVCKVLSITAALKHTSPCIFYLIKNATLPNTASWVVHDTESCTHVDTTAATVTFANNSQIIWTGHLGDTGALDHYFGNFGTYEEIDIQPGEVLTLAAKSSTGTPAYVTASINTREDK